MLPPSQTKRKELHGVYLESIIRVYGGLRWGDIVDFHLTATRETERLRDGCHLRQIRQGRDSTAQISLNSQSWFVQRMLFPWTRSGPHTGRTDVKASSVCPTGGQTEGTAGFLGLQKGLPMGYKVM